jgi:Holliday junction resolvasome RuvABC endonuclease subunit
MRIIGVDGGLAHMGIADLELTRARGALWMNLLGGEVVETTPAKKKHGIRKGDDNMRRAREVAAKLQWHIVHGGPTKVQLLVYEAQSFGMKGSVAARQAGTAFGIIAAMAEVYEIPMLCVTPGDIKKAVCPELTKATKDDVIRAVETRWPSVPWPTKKDNWEHLADAIAAGWACRDDEIVRALLRAEAA